MFKIHEDSWYSVNDNFCLNDLFTYRKIKTNKQITYYNDVIAFDIETSSFTDDSDIDINYKDTDVYEHILNTKIKIPQSIYSDIPDFTEIRRSLFGRITFSKTDGISIDSFYRELMEYYPYYFSDDIINPADQLEQILSVFYENSPEKEDYNNKRAIMYVWQVAINGRVIIGRTWAEFKKLMDDISEHFNLDSNRRMIVWVHNLAFEFGWLQNIFHWEKVFAISSRKPIYALTTTGIEFRCSYILSNMSLSNVGLSLHKYPVQKQIGYLDYELVRHNKTPLTGEDTRTITPGTEIAYCCYDVLVVSAYIKECMEAEGDNITKLPLTATGYCRKYVKYNCLRNGDKKNDSPQFKSYHSLISRLKISGPEEYYQMVRAFTGGYTHGSAIHSMQVLEEVDSFDFTSSYPYVLCSEQYPMSSGKVVPVTSYAELNKYCQLYCCIFDVKFTNIKPVYMNENYIPLSKCLDREGKPFTDKTKVKYGIVSNNGRLVSCDDTITMTITNVDYEIIKKCYKWSDIKIGTFRIYKKGYLPKEIIQSITKLYKDKTELKGVKGMEDFYTKGKQLLNSIYGMMVTSIIMPVHTYTDNAGWDIEHKDVEEEIRRYNRSKKRFLYYPWGIFCTAYARRNLWSGILAFGEDFCYADTDSLKVLNAEKHMNYINAYNRMVERKLKMVAAYYDIPFEDFKPKTIKGVEKMLGVWDKETEDGKWKKLKFLGAKRYMVLEADNTLTLTVSGINKKLAIPYIIKTYGIDKAFDAFSDKLVIPAEYTGDMTHYYIDEIMSGDVTDYLGNTAEYYEKSGIYLEKATYNFSIDAAYMDYLRELRGEIA